MSGIKKAAKKVFRPIEKIASKVLNVSTLGLWNKTKKIRHKIIKSKAFKIALGAAAIYFGGAALLSLAGGGTAAAGLGSAWGGLQGAGSALMAGNFSGAASALGAGFTGGAAAGAGATFAAGQAATAASLSGAATSATTAGVAGVGGGITANGVTAATPAAQGGLASFGLSTTAPGAATVGGSVVPAAAKSAGLLGLGEAGTAALVMGGVNMAGQMLQGHAAEKAAEEERKRRNTWGASESGQSFVPDISLTAPAPYPGGPNGYTQPPQWQPKTLDDLINETRNRTNANSGLLWG